MIFKYYSQWVFYLFILWLFGYLLKIDTITKYINPYYATLVAAVGYTFWIFYLIGKLIIKYEDINTWIPQQKYDIVFSMETLYYFKNPGKIINKIYDEVLNKRGTFIMGIDHYAENTPSLDWGEKFNLDITTLSIEDWLAFFESAGFKNISYKQVEVKKGWLGTLIIQAEK